MSCRLPSGIEGLTALSDSTRAGHVAVGKVPFSRWDMDAVTLQSSPDIPRDIKTRMSFGGFVDDLELFDANFSRILHWEHYRSQKKIPHCGINATFFSRKNARQKFQRYSMVLLVL